MSRVNSNEIARKPVVTSTRGRHNSRSADDVITPVVRRTSGVSLERGDSTARQGSSATKTATIARSTSAARTSSTARKQTPPANVGSRTSAPPVRRSTPSGERESGLSRSSPGVASTETPEQPHLVARSSLHGIDETRVSREPETFRVRLDVARVLGMHLGANTLRVYTVVPGSQAEAAGVDAGWRCVAVMGDPVSSLLAFKEAVAKARALGETVSSALGATNRGNTVGAWFDFSIEDFADDAGDEPDEEED